MKTARYPKLRDILLPVVGSRSEQWVADLCGVSQPAVSKWLSGYARPRQVHLAILASLFKQLDPYALAEAAGYEPEEIVRLCEVYSSGVRGIPDQLDFAIEKIDLSHKLRIRGDPDLALDQTITAASGLREALKRYSSPKNRKPLLVTLSKLLLEQAVALSVSYFPHLSFERIRSVVEEQHSIAEELEEDKPLGRAYLSLGDAYYGLRRYERYDKARFYFSEASDMVKDKYYRARAFRGVALSSAYLGDQKGFERAERKVKQLLDKEQFSASTTCMLIEGLGRAQGLLNQPRALKTLEEGWKILAGAEAQGEKAIHRQVQLVRTEMVVALHLEKENKTLIQEIGAKGLYLAHQNRYLRYAEEMEELLQQILN